ncbi:tetraacyldisaccharide 4'-kinase [Acetobacteraceae bacterium KSS8]|uniref:Tetraacyldisaccharide 4'-kinase n=1 Tax=Endosaccharibacter trunci TaxID=2812733 RepID=A0ABT1W6T9_9PROT|nr:tetraacyldisaccharide 4'-kinase [Acetobacteraceae bacterium KSS8]
MSPLEPITAALTARRLRREGWAAPVPVVCCGNAGVGGAGKTTLALDLASRLTGRGLRVHCLTRGYGGRGSATPLLVDPLKHDAAAVGDEALLLAAIAPCWVGADRAASARAATEAGAELLVMDDGLQNPGLKQDMPILVIDGAVGFGNRRLLPAGPLREPVRTAAARARCAVVIGEERAPVADLLPAGLPVLRATLAMDPSVRALAGRPVFAFAGIARPEKFFDSLRAETLDLVGTRGFADHRPFRPDALRRLREEAAALGATLVTTPKDAVRLSPEERAGIAVAGVSLRWSDEDALGRLLDRIVAA